MDGPDQTRQMEIMRFGYPGKDTTKGCGYGQQKLFSIGFLA